MRNVTLLFLVMILALFSVANGQNVTEEWVVLNADENAPAWMAASDARGIDFNANSVWNGLNPSVSEIWITKATDEDAPEWISGGGQARGIDVNINSTHTGKTILLADNNGNGVHVHDAVTGAYLWSLDTTGVDTVFDGHVVSPYRVAVTADGQIFVNSFDGIIVWWADDAAETVPQIVINLSGEAGNSRALEVVGSGTDVRLFMSKGTDIRVFDMNGSGQMVEMTDLTIATGWADECETIASNDSNLVYAAQGAGGGDQSVNRRVYNLTESGYVNDTEAVANLPYLSWFVVQGLDVADDYYIMSESGGANDGFAIGTINGYNYSPLSGDTDGDNIYDGGMNSPSLVTDICIDPETYMVYWTAPGSDEFSGFGCIRPNEFTTNSIIVADDDNNTIHVHSAVDGTYWYDLSSEGLGGLWTASAVAPYRVAVTSDGQIFANTFDGYVVKWVNDADTTMPEIVVNLSGESGFSRSIEVVGSGSEVTIMVGKGNDVRAFTDDGTGTFVENTGAIITDPFTGNDVDAIASVDGSTVWLSNNGGGVANRAVYTWNETAYVKDEDATNALPFTAFVAQGLDVDPDDNLYILGEAGGSLDGIAAGTLDGTNYPPLDEGLDSDGDGVYDAGGTINAANLVVDVAFDMITNNLYWTSAGTGGGVGMLHVNVPDPAITIAEARVDDNEDYVPDKLDDTVVTSGIITSPNYSTNTEYWMQDSTAGIVLHSDAVALNLSEGDEVQVRGTVGQVNGLTVVVIDAAEDVSVLSSGNNVEPVHITIAEMDELTEGWLVQVDSVMLIDPEAWPAEGNTGEVHFTDGTDTAAILIDAETDLDEWTPPMGHLNIIAVADQNTMSVPADDGYLLRGTYQEDFIDLEPDVPVLPLIEMATDGTLDLEWDFNVENAYGRSEIYVADSTASAWGSHVAVFDKDTIYTALAHVKDAVFKNYTIEADIYINAEPTEDFNLYTGIGIKMAHEETAYYRLVYRNSTGSDHGQLRLQGYDGANWHISQYWNPGVDFEALETGWHNFKVTVYENNFWAYVDGELLPGCPYSDESPFLSEGYPGIYAFDMNSSRVVFDNFMVTEPVIPAPEPEKLITLWQQSVAAGNYPEYMSTSNYERGMAAGNGKVYVVTRFGAHRIVYHDAMTGAFLGEIPKPADAEGVGLFHLNAVDVSDDGIIFVCNMSLGSDETHPFRVYRWDDETADPQTVISYEGGVGRLGDMFSVYGRADDNSLVIYAAVSGGTQIVKFTTDDFGSTFTPTIINLPPDAMGSVPNVADFGDSTIYVKSYGKPLIHYTMDGTLIDTVSTEVVGTSASKISALDMGDEKIILAYYPNVGGGSGSEYAVGVDVTYGAKNAFLRGYTSSLGDATNGNGTGSVDFMLVDQEEVLIFVFGTNNGLGAFSPNEDFVLAEMDTLFYGDTPTVHVNPYGWGYIAGTNGYGDIGKFQRMDFLTGDALQGMKYQFAVKSVVNDPDTLHMVVRTVGENGAPDSLLAAIPVTTDMIDTTMMGNTFFLDAPMMLDGPVFLGFEMIGTWDDTLAIYADADGEGEGENRAWEQFSDFAYNDFGTTLNPDYSWGLDVDLWTTAYYKKGGGTDISDENLHNRPTGFALSQNYPNPFNPTTRFDVSLPTDAKVKIVVYNALGQKVKTLVNNNLPAGMHQFQFDGSHLASGVYFYQIEAGKFSAVKKMILIK